MQLKGWLVVLALVVVLAMTVVFAAELRREWVQRNDDAFRHLAALARTLEQHAMRTVYSTDLLLVEMVAAVEAGALTGPTPEPLARTIHWESLKLEPGSFIDSQYRSSESDLLFSTRPSPRDPDRVGTLRRLNLRTNREELFRGDDTNPISSPIQVSADSARLIPGDEFTLATVKVCFRTTCFQGNVGTVIDDIIESDNGAQLGVKAYKPEFAFSDTTFVAASGDYRTVVFGSGGTDRDPSRIWRFEDQGDEFAINYGNTADLVKNSWERVLGLSLNFNGSTGIARGDQSYLFDGGLRLQGVVTTGTPTGGVALNPRQGACPGRSDPECIAFVSGTEVSGRPYIDAIDTFHFDSLSRIYLSEPVIGGLVAVPVGAPNDSGVRFRLYGITESGVVTVEIYPQDLVKQ
jgi:hypothetical protein